MKNLLLLFAGAFLSMVIYLAMMRWSHNQDVSLDEIRHRMLPVDRDLLLEIDQDSALWTNKPTDHSLRHDVRHALDDVKEHFHRIWANAGRLKDCATFYRSIDKRQRSEDLNDVEPDSEEAQELQAYFQARAHAIQRSLDTIKDLRSLLRRDFLVIWIADMSAFNKREWGPIPDFARLRIQEVLGAYERVKMAAVNLASACGEGGISEQLAEQM